MKSLNSSNFKTKIFLSSSLIWLSMVSGIALGKSNNLQKALKSYAIVADFEEESSIRRVNDQVYWSYPFVDTNDDFKNHTTKFAINAHDIPPTIGSGLVVQHLNRGRELFLEGNYTEAAKIWRSASLNSTAKDLYFRRFPNGK